MMTNAEIKLAAYENGCDGRRWEERHYLCRKGFLETRGEAFHNLRRAKWMRICLITIRWK